jgi:hypothetical protein
MFELLGLFTSDCGKPLAVPLAELVVEVPLGFALALEEPLG